MIIIIIIIIIIQIMVGQIKIESFMDYNLNDFFSLVSNKLILFYQYLFYILKYKNIIYI